MSELSRRDESMQAKEYSLTEEQARGLGTWMQDNWKPFLDTIDEQAFIVAGETRVDQEKQDMSDIRTAGGRIRSLINALLSAPEIKIETLDSGSEFKFPGYDSELHKPQPIENKTITIEGDEYKGIAGAIRHMVNNPLNVLGYAEMIQKKGRFPEQMRHLLENSEAIKKGVERFKPEYKGVALSKHGGEDSLFLQMLQEQQKPTSDELTPSHT